MRRRRIGLAVLLVGACLSAGCVTFTDGTRTMHVLGTQERPFVSIANEEGSGAIVDEVTLYPPAFVDATVEVVGWVLDRIFSPLPGMAAVMADIR